MVRIDTAKRVNTGPIQLGDDWPGIFVRGDECFAYALRLKELRKQSTDIQTQKLFDELVSLFESPIV